MTLSQLSLERPLWLLEQQERLERWVPLTERPPEPGTVLSLYPHGLVRCSRVTLAEMLAFLFYR